MKNVIKLKYNYLLDELFTNNRIIDDESIEMQKRRRILTKFSNRYDKEVIKYDDKLEKTLLLNSDFNSDKKSKYILKNLIEQENIKNELSQLFTDLLLDGQRLRKQLEIDLNFIKKTNNFIIRLLSLDKVAEKILSLTFSSFVPFGPVNDNFPFSTFTLVSFGIDIGFFPSLDIIY